MGKTSRKKKEVYVAPEAGSPQRTESRIKSKTASLILTLIIFLVSFAVYFNALFNDFVYDDIDQVLRNPWIKDMRHLPDMFLKGVWSFKSEHSSSNYYRPMMHVIYMLNYHIFGLKPWGFHLVNVLFHAGSSVLVFIISSIILSRQRHPNLFSSLDEKSGSKRIFVTRPEITGLLLPFAAAVLFATHPIHTEAVTWVAGVPDVSYTFFLLLSLYFYLKSRERMRGAYHLSLTSFAISVFCKEPALSLPLIIIAHDYVYTVRSDKSEDSQTGRPFIVPRHIPYLVISGLYLGLRFYALRGFSPQRPNVVLSTYGYIINVFPLFIEYIEKLLLPLQLNAFHVLHPISSILQPLGILSLGLTSVFFVLVFFAIKKRNSLFFGLAVIILPLLPALYIPAVGENVFAERYLYLPSFGFVLLIVLLSVRISEKYTVGKTAMAATVIILTALYSIGTVRRNAVWRDDYSLWTDTVKKSPDGEIPRNHLGLVYMKRGMTDFAIEQYKAVLDLYPNDAESHNNLGVAYKKKGLLNEAISHYKAALEIKPDDAAYRSNLGNAYRETGSLDEAIEQYKISLKLDPSDADTHNDMGIALEKMGLMDQAIEHLSEAVRLAPENHDYRRDLAKAYELRKQH